MLRATTHVLFLFSVVAAMAVATACAEDAVPGVAPLPGQIIVDPDHPNWLMRQGGAHVYICGPGDPEGFLYRGARNADGTRDGDQAALIDKLATNGGNCIYLQVVRSHGGDGTPDHNPFVDSDPSKGVDMRILDQWEEWFTVMDRNGILIYLFFYDDGAVVWNAKGESRNNVAPGERAFIQTVVDKFEHHKNLIWIVGEESDEAYSNERVRAIAQTIHEADDHAHIVGDHENSGTTFDAWEPGCAMTHFSMQFQAPGDDAHAGAIEGFQKGQGKFQTIYSENTSGEPTPQYAWRVAMGGLMPMMLEMDIANTPAETLNQCRHLQRFFESTDFSTMAPHDELAHAGTKWVLAIPGQSYIAYAEHAPAKIGVKALSAGSYAITWLDCGDGTTEHEQTNVDAEADHAFHRPGDIGEWCALWIKKRSDRPTVFPGATWETRTPSEAGFDAAKLHELGEAIGGDGVVVRDGYLVHTWGVARQRGDWASSSKPLVSTMLLFAVSTGKLESVDDLIRPFVQQRWPDSDLIEKDQTITFRHLADMVSGYARAEAPGSHWAYNDSAIRLYFHMTEQVNGAPLNDIALTYFNPLQFEDGGIFGSRGGFGVDASPSDFARIGWFWLNKGYWDGQWLLPPSYFDTYCRPDVPRGLPRTQAPGEDYLQAGGSVSGTDQDFPGAGVYGFNWWFNAPMDGSAELLLPHLPRDTFYALGHQGKEVMLVIPSLRIVLAARGDWGGSRLTKTTLLMEAVAAR